MQATRLESVEFGHCRICGAVLTSSSTMTDAQKSKFQQSKKGLLFVGCLSCGLEVDVALAVQGFMFLSELPELSQNGKSLLSSLFAKAITKERQQTSEEPYAAQEKPFRVSMCSSDRGLYAHNT